MILIQLLTSWLFISLLFPTCNAILIHRNLDKTKFSLGGDDEAHSEFTSQKKLAVHVHFQPNTTKKNSSDYTIRMILALYSSTSLLSSGCAGFDSFSLSQHNSTVFLETKTISFSNLNARGHIIANYLFLDKSHWALSKNTILATNCKSSGNNFARTGLWGILGMGFDQQSKENYQGHSPFFSILIKPDGVSGELTFTNDTQKALNISSPVAALPSSPDWHIFNAFLLSHRPRNKEDRPTNLLERNAKVIFDLNSDEIGLPVFTYHAFLKELQHVVSDLECSSMELSRPVCEFTGDIDDLPTFDINVGGVKIPIYPRIYVARKNVKHGEIHGSMTLNLKAISHNLTGNNYVTPEFDDTIILDSNFMSYYYIIFSKDQEKEQGKITLYVASHSVYVKVQKTIFWKVFTFCTVVVAAFGVWLYKKIKRRLEASKEVVKESYISMVENPFVV